MEEIFGGPRGGAENNFKMVLKEAEQEGVVRINLAQNRDVVNSCCIDYTY